METVPQLSDFHYTTNQQHNNQLIRSMHRTSSRQKKLSRKKQQRANELVRVSERAKLSKPGKRALKKKQKTDLANRRQRKASTLSKQRKLDRAFKTISLSHNDMNWISNDSRSYSDQAAADKLEFINNNKENVVRKFQTTTDDGMVYIASPSRLRSSSSANLGHVCCASSHNTSMEEQQWVVVQKEKESETAGTCNVQ